MYDLLNMELQKKIIYNQGWFVPYPVGDGLEFRLQHCSIVLAWICRSQQDSDEECEWAPFRPLWPHNRLYAEASSGKLKLLSSSQWSWRFILSEKSYKYVWFSFGVRLKWRVKCKEICYSLMVVFTQLLVLQVCISYMISTYIHTLNICMHVLVWFL